MLSNSPYTVSRFRRAFMHFIGGRVVQAIARAILLLMIVRVLEVEEYGAYMLVVGIAEMTLLVASFGLVSLGQRYVPQYATNGTRRMTTKFVTGLLVMQGVILILVALGAWLLWPKAASFLGIEQQGTSINTTVALLIFLVPAFRFVGELLEALLEQARVQIARALMPIGRVIGLVGLIYSGMSVGFEQVLIIDVLVTLICLLLAVGFLINRVNKLSDGQGEKPSTREMVRFAWHMAWVNLLSSTSTPGAIRVVVAGALSIVEVGIFGFLQSIQRLVSRYMPGVLLRGLVRPILVSRAVASNDLEKVSYGANILIKSNLLMVGFGCVIVGVAGDQLVDLLSGGKFPDSGFTLLLLLIALAVTSQRPVYEMVMQITGHTRTLTATSFVAPVSLAMMWFCSDWGLNAVVVIIGVGATISNGIALYVLTKDTSYFRIDQRGNFTIVIASFVAIICGLFAAQIGGVTIGLVVAICLFPTALIVLRPFSRDEYHLMQKALGKRLSKPLALLTRA